MEGSENDPSVPVLSEGDRFEDCKDWVWEVERQKGLVISLELKLEEKDRKLASLEIKQEEKDRKLDKLRRELEGYDSKYWKIREEKCELNEDYRNQAVACACASNCLVAIRIPSCCKLHPVLMCSS